MALGDIMSLSAEKLLTLLGAIENDTLVFLCGAGLSMPEPSFLPSAPQVAKTCYDRRTPVEALDPKLEWDVDELAGFFYKRGDFLETFIPIVPWNDLAGQPNEGHAAVADFLVCRAAHGALSANFDTMIERWAENRKVDLVGALTGQEATDFSNVANPLLKFHGCMKRSKKDTLWTKGQLDEDVVKKRVESCSNWMNLHLPGKHLVVVGFWTDWGYLNSVIAEAFTITTAASVTVVDTATSVALQAKAPDLWEKLNTLSASFEHVQASGTAVLEQLRTAYSQTWVRKFYALGKPAADALGIATVPSPDAIKSDGLYDMRRDVEGVAYTRAASLKAPPTSAGEAALAHIKLLSSGATQDGAWLKHSGKSVRIVNGNGKHLETLKESHKEPSTLPQPDMVICTGAINLGVPARLIASGKGASVVSPAGGGASNWLTLPEALAELAV